MTQINIIGNFLDTSGFSIHTRELANALNKITKVRLEAMVPANVATQLNDQEVEMLKREPEDDQINLIITSPIYWRLNTYAKRNWAYMIFEGDKIPKSWISECLNPDIEYIFVPSMHTYDAVMCMLPKEEAHKLIRVPHGVDLNKFYPKKEEVASTGNTEGVSQDASERPFVFLCNKGFRNLEDRGGIQYAIKAYLEEFNPEDKVELLIKLNPAYGIPDMNNLISQLKPDKPSPNIRIDVGNYQYKDLVKLYHEADVFVSPTRAESFNIPCTEAMACGLPVITTDFGGQTDFCTNDTGWLVSGDLKLVEHEIQYEETKWLTPDITQLKKAMREAYATHKEKGQKVLEVAKQFTWDSTAEKIINLTGDSK